MGCYDCRTRSLGHLIWASLLTGFLVAHFTALLLGWALGEITMASHSIPSCIAWMPLHAHSQKGFGHVGSKRHLLPCAWKLHIKSVDTRPRWAAVIHSSLNYAWNRIHLWSNNGVNLEGIEDKSLWWLNGKQTLTGYQDNSNVPRISA